MLALKCQPYITAKQLYRQYRLLDKVEYGITDTSLLFASIYPGFAHNQDFEKWVLHAWKQFNTLTFFLRRNAEYHPYNPKGRNQTEAEAEIVDAQILELYISLELPFFIVDAGDDAYKRIYDITMGAGII